MSIGHVASRSRGSSRHRELGGVYIMVLIGSVIISLIGLSAITLARMSIRSSARTDDWVEAQFLAESALEHALLTVTDEVEADPTNWRLSFAHGEVVLNKSNAKGQFQWTILDASGDNDLKTGADDPVRLVASATVNTSSYGVAIEMEPTTGTAPLDCLDASVQVGGNIDVSWATMTSDQAIRANGDISATSASVTGTVESAGSSSGSTYQTAPTEGAPARQMPGSDVFDYYIARGTPIDLASLYSSFGVRFVKNVVLSPNTNPYGDPNPEGIYVLDCGGTNVEITESRIVGTLVLLEPGPDSRINNAVNWEPAYPNYPALLVRGDLESGMHTAALSEFTWYGFDANYNPPGTPYLGASDASVTGEYPSVIAGLIYVTGNLRITHDDTTIEGALVVGGDLIVESGASLSVLYRDAFTVDPPWGFRSTAGGPLAVVSGTYARDLGQ